MQPVPRATQDIDVIIEPTHEQLVSLMDKFAEPIYDADRDDALDAFIDDRCSASSIAEASGRSTLLRKPRPFSKKEFDRRRRIQILDVSVYAATPEDVLLAKLE